MKNHHLLILLIVFLAACSGNSSLSSFGSRKYTKGYFFNAPAEKPKVEAKTKIEFKQVLVQEKTEQSPETARSVQRLEKPFIGLKEPVLMKKQSVYMAKSVEKVVNTERINEKSPVADNPDDSASDEKTTGIMFSIIGLLSLIGFFIAPHVVFLAAIPGWIFLLIGILALIVGLVYLAHMGNKEKPVTDTSNEKASNLGALGLVFALISGGIVGLVTLIVLVTILTGNVFEIPLVFIVLLCLGAITGLTLCLIAKSKSNEKDPGLAKRGANIAAIALILALLILFVGLLNVPL